jgi:predicted Rossmann-fold nucleotide-binding protein
MYVISVVGVGHCAAPIARLAEEIGRLLAHNGLVVLTSGRGRVLEAASRGAKKREYSLSEIHCR